MGVQSAATAGASTNRTRACTRGPGSSVLAALLRKVKSDSSVLATFYKKCKRNLTRIDFFLDNYVQNFRRGLEIVNLIFVAEYTTQGGFPQNRTYYWRSFTSKIP